MGAPSPSGELIAYSALPQCCPLLNTSKERLQTRWDSQALLSGTEWESTGRQKASKDDSEPTENAQ